MRDSEDFTWPHNTNRRCALVDALSSRWQLTSGSPICSESSRTTSAHSAFPVKLRTGTLFLAAGRYNIVDVAGAPKPNGSARKRKLSVGMTLRAFDNGYWYATELRAFALKMEIPFASKLRKDQLEAAIKDLLFADGGEEFRQTDIAYESQHAPPSTRRAKFQNSLNKRGFCASYREALWPPISGK
jgi:SAP domain-containing new25